MYLSATHKKYKKYTQTHNKKGDQKPFLQKI